MINDLVNSKKIDLLKKQIKENSNSLDQINQNVPFKFGIDKYGNYGYIKEGADSVTPF